MRSQWIMWIAGGTVLLAIALVLVRALLGPTVYDRVLAVNTLGTKTIILVAIVSFTTERPEFLDIALLYTLINFVITIAILKYKEYGRLE
ncbi:MAG TPA: monovalent cation/H+ antiporter complex subunit F [Candidatus Acidoferrales bacterium]|nr:monovalent cation/H+ antiporter complex subunit F [Candidatus Acidoferrales bacterium]